MDTNRRKSTTAHPPSPPAFPRPVGGRVLPALLSGDPLEHSGIPKEWASMEIWIDLYTIQSVKMFTKICKKIEFPHLPCSR